MQYTYQDFEAYLTQGKVSEFIGTSIRDHMNSAEYRVAVDANEYDHQRDITIRQYTQLIAEKAGNGFADVTAANNRISSNYFHRLNTQRCTYSLGNGISFPDSSIKDKLGPDFDKDMYSLAYKSLIHGECFGFWNLEKLYVFPITEFVPFFDEYTGALRAGIRFWRLKDKKPINAVLYTESGYSKYRSQGSAGTFEFELIEPMKSYITHSIRTDAGDYEIIGTENYSTLPIKRMYGSGLHQSTLVGMRERLDSLDLIQSGFANDLQDCAQIYWIIENCNGMDDEDLQEFLNRIKTKRIATADTKGMGADSSSLKPYVQDVPYQSRMAYLDHIRKAIYEDFGALDVHAVAAGSTNDHLQAAYQPMDENADDFEYQCIDFIQQILELMGITGTDAVPQFNRNRICNQMEQTQMVMMEASVLDTETLLSKLPNVTVDEIPTIMARKREENMSRFDQGDDFEDEENDSKDDSTAATESSYNPTP